MFGGGIIASPNVPAGTAVVANLRAAVQLYEREVPLIEWGTINDQCRRTCSPPAARAATR